MSEDNKNNDSSLKGNLSVLDAKDVCYAIYILNILAPFTGGLTGLVAGILCLLKRKEANDILQSHYEYQMRSFWLGLILLGVGVVLTIILVGFVILGVLAIWWLIRNMVGLKRLMDGLEISDPKTLLI